MRPIHACFVNSMRSLGGAEVWMLDAAHGLQDRGQRVSIVTQPDAELLLRARRLGIATAAIPIRCDGAVWTIARLARYFRRTGVDAIFCNLTKDLKAAGVAGRLAGVSVILASRESDFPLKDKLYYRLYFNKIASGVVVNSLATRQTVLASVPWLDPARLQLLYKGVDLTRFRPAATPPPTPTVGFVGQLIERKGLPEIMAAWTALESEPWPELPQLRLAGEGKWRDRLQRWRATLQHPERVEILGYVEPIETFLNTLSLLIMPSREEGFGLAAAEASASGLPVIAAHASSLPEIVLDGQTGLLVPPRDAVALAAAIKRLLHDTDLLVRLGRRGRQVVQERFGRERMLDELQRLLAGAGS